MKLYAEGHASTIKLQLSALCPEIPPAPPVKLQMLDYQMAAVFMLARQYGRNGARILEIGTGHGGSGYMLSKAAPLARITSLTVSEPEAAFARRFWAAQGCHNIEARGISSWTLLQEDARAWDMVFVDGDHNAIARDLPWFNRLRLGGLFLCHDYSPQDSRSPSAVVYAELNAAAAKLGRGFDVRIVDDGKVGMAGFYRRRGEVL